MIARKLDVGGGYMDENEFEIDGKVFVAKQRNGGCDGCYFDIGGECHAVSGVPACATAIGVSGGMFLIFVEKQK